MRPRMMWALLALVPVAVGLALLWARRAPPSSQSGPESSVGRARGLGSVVTTALYAAGLAPRLRFPSAVLSPRAAGTGGRSRPGPPR